MTEPTLYERDLAAIAGIEKLRFFPLELASGKGSILTTPDGRELIDLSATWTACGLGHGHPAVIEAITRAIQSPPGAGGLSAVHPDSVGLAEDLLALVPGTGERRVYLGHAGSDANDVAIRACIIHSGRKRVLAFEHGYHGGVGIAMGVSGVHVEGGSAAAAEGTIFAPYPDPLRPHADNGGDEVGYCLAQVRAALEGDDVACVIVEPILSDGGLIVPPPGFLSRLMDLAREFGVPLICDEVKVGLGRPGTLHAFEDDGIVPDIVTFGKTLGGGLPISAAVGPARILDVATGSALLTMAGNPISTAAARAVLATLVDEGLADAARERGEQLKGALTAIERGEGRFGDKVADRIGDVRGRGLAIAVDLVSDKAALTRDEDLARKVVYRAWQLGAVVFYVGGNVLEITPPLVITEEQVDAAVTILEQAISDAVDGLVSDEEVAPYSGW
ncbi:aspartate aminotransferase family protein [Compostimonas suwonensis]|uniref:4-aminobutyrate aminotransferase n=1 Tax=Compostimonas suwonensis TaxID=1048394 RepID=A0A2M9BUV5_9MICO|nr:aspartate aminotransferase family protein [Compostimonas suwonensis]PJJ61700.1 4-aminobutyrate aminotransferase [Compostimonas suwonensis]